MQHIPLEHLLVLIFEEDVLADPQRGLRRAFEFLGVDPDAIQADPNVVNARRLSRPGIRLMNMFSNVPFARSIVWRIDVRLPLKRWRPTFSQETRQRLKALYAPENERLFELIGHRIESWE